jgi:hypothetical protein
MGPRSNGFARPAHRAFGCPVLFGLNDEATGGLFRSEVHGVRLCGWRTGVLGSTLPA